MDKHMKICRENSPCVAPHLCEPANQCIAVKRVIMMDNDVPVEIRDSLTQLCFYLQNQKPIDLFMEEKGITYDK
jgi:hypothetical protein